MIRLLPKLIVLIVFLFSPPQNNLHAQSSPVGENGLFQTQENPETDTDKDDKKKKKKDEEVPFFSFTIERFDLAFFSRLLVNILCLIILIRFVYYPVYGKRDYFFTFFMFNITIFIITFLLNGKSSFSTGAAFGLFAVFSLLRYRTEDISARDMTYLFTVIALGLISAVNKGNIIELIIINTIILLVAFLLDGNILLKTEFVKTIQYENIELIKPENHTALIEDLKKRTGLNIHKVSIGRIDFLRDTASIKVYYYDNRYQDV
jgi:hypothetical protein